MLLTIPIFCIGIAVTNRSYLYLFIFFTFDKSDFIHVSIGILVTNGPKKTNPVRIKHLKCYILKKTLKECLKGRQDI